MYCQYTHGLWGGLIQSKIKFLFCFFCFFMNCSLNFFICKYLEQPLKIGVCLFGHFIFATFCISDMATRGYIDMKNDGEKLLIIPLLSDDN